ncbi:hypothetical protein [Ktedonobacter racemifer]|uniref:hypothetical protein n=1 Tax=Ktedonobacter racemifer TaxID=363277 RepID=UPI00058C66D1|nr:hypothetical protein [Ktedonobacter racemifer]
MCEKKKKKGIKKKEKQARIPHRWCEKEDQRKCEIGAKRRRDGGERTEASVEEQGRYGGG